MKTTKVQMSRQRLTPITGFATALLFSITSFTVQALDLPDPPEEGDFPVHLPEKVDLGKLLFYDKLLGGNKNMSCASCHHALAFLGDGLSLPVGEGGIGLGIARNTGGIPPIDPDGIHERVPRNAPHFPNGGAFEFVEQFWDGRVEKDDDHPSGFRSPAGSDLPPGLDNVLAVQAMFPVTSPAEMAGQNGENPVGDAAVLGDVVLVWDLLAARLQDPLNGYVDLFKDAYPPGTPTPPGPVNQASDITYVHAANAIAAYEDVEFRAINSPFDRFLRGDRRAMSYNQQTGMRLFYGKAGCFSCHSGKFQTDHGYHAVGFPQIGPGKGDIAPGGDQHADFGRERVTGNPDDRYKFRTPPLRNTALTGPWGHDGAYDTLEAVVRHKMDPVDALNNYDTGQAVLPPRADLDAIDFISHDSQTNRDAIAAAIDPLLVPVALSDQEVRLLIEFLHALTDPAKIDLRHTVPMEVPSGLPIAD